LRRHNCIGRGCHWFRCVGLTRGIRIHIFRYRNAQFLKNDFHARIDFFVTNFLIIQHFTDDGYVHGWKFIIHKLCIVICFPHCMNRFWNRYKSSLILTVESENTANNKNQEKDQKNRYANSLDLSNKFLIRKYVKHLVANLLTHDFQENFS